MCIRMKRSINFYFRHVSLTINKIVVFLVHGQFICNQCTVFNTAERDDWLKHLRKYHYSAFVLLVREREDCPTALNDQPLANISDNEDDDDDETANIGTPRFEFDALTASIDSHRLASQRRFQPGRPAPNINQYCLIPQQQLQFGNTTADPLEQSQVRDKTIKKVGKCFLPEFMRLSE
ncbi:unnamed protein product [Rotaria magnacalcarata]|uniref:Uncharacterized protein n=1 Tax=Rotaria magnacalcarata TaxID=392030 RepID=A0A816WT09_9BILA|nr:unnamed protein product [Rotaria magnacalcarata]CAF2137783.1 unnamed protein product [Rotaria magnacalcarata]